jgi:hypothetical protein
MRLRILLILLCLLIAVNAVLFAVYFGVFNNKTIPARSFTLHCPVPGRYCRQGKVIKIKNQYLGLGFNVPADAPVTAVLAGGAFAGKVLFSDELGGQTHPSITLKSEQGDLEVYYAYVGSMADFRRVVKRGEQLTKLQSGSLGAVSANLLIRVFRVDANKKTALPLEAKDFANP